MIRWFIRLLRPWRPVRPWREWSVLARMVLSVAALAAVALVIADLAGMALMRSYLLYRIDTQLFAQARGFARIGSLSEFQVDRPRGGNAFGPDFRILLYSATGQVVQRTGTADAEPDLGTLADLERHAQLHRPYTVEGPTASWRVLVTELPEGRGYGAGAVSLREVQATSDQLLLVSSAVSAVVLLLIALAAAMVVRIGLRPLTRMEATAAAIAGGDLSRRVADADPHTESGRLAMALNTMLSRIEEAAGEQAASARRMRQFLADAAHELRTPLTSIQGFAELYRRGGAPPGPPLDEAMACIEAEVSRMRLLVNDLLLLARVDEERPLERRPVDLLAVAADAVRDAHVRVPSRFVRLSAIGDDHDQFEPVTVLGDEARLRQVVSNLVANALQHTPDQATVVVRVGRPEAEPVAVPPTTAVGADLPPDAVLAAIEVADSGPGMATADAHRAFERLYRADGSRSRRQGGAGLGLSIVASIVQAHGGRVELWTGPGAGARFRVLLPAQPPADDAEDWPGGRLRAYSQEA
jgi:two-component system OmpR family sensor kinase